MTRSLLLVRIYVAIVCLAPLGLFAQPISGPFPYLEGTKYGFGTLQGKKLTEAIYDTHSFFHFGYCAVRQGCCYGVLDTTFTWVLPPQFDYCEVADTGLFLCRSGNKTWVYRHDKQILYSENNKISYDRKIKFIIKDSSDAKIYYYPTGSRSKITTKRYSILADVLGPFLLIHTLNSAGYWVEKGVIKNKNDSIILNCEEISCSNPILVNDSILSVKMGDSLFVSLHQNGHKELSQIKDNLDFYAKRNEHILINDTLYFPDKTKRNFWNTILLLYLDDSGEYYEKDSMEYGPIRIYNQQHILIDSIEGFQYEAGSILEKERQLLVYFTKPIWKQEKYRHVNKSHFVRFGGKNFLVYKENGKDCAILNARRVSNQCFVYEYYIQGRKSGKTRKVCNCVENGRLRYVLYHELFQYQDSIYLLRNKEMANGSVRQDLYSIGGELINSWPFDITDNKTVSFDIDYKRPVDTNVNGECVFAYRLICFDHPIRGSHSQYMYQSVQTKKDGLYIELDTTQVLDKLGLPRFGVSVINGTIDTLWFSTTDLKISLIVQAQDSMGLWHDIEYLNEMFYAGETHFFKCHIALPPANGWQFQVPVYQGASQVNMRLKLCSDRSHYTRRLPDRYRIHPEVYSEVFRGYINPAQMWRMPVSSLDFR